MNNKVEFSDFSDFKQVLKDKFHVKNFRSSVPKKIQKEIEEFESGEGLHTDFSNVFHTNNQELITVLGDGSIKKAIVHIVDITIWMPGWSLPRYHIYECKKIIEMKERNRGYRYKLSGRKDGLFYLMKSDSKKETERWYEKLEICSYCLDKYNEDYIQSDTKGTFKLNYYLQKENNGNVILVDIELDICTIPNNYSDDWSKISKKMKEDADYKCKNCYRDFSKKEVRKFLHTHHKDGNKRDNIRGNLTVLCIECHAEHHSHLKSHKDYKEYIAKFKIKNPEQ